MLFNSYEFLFGFLPIAWLAHRWLAHRAPALATPWLALASLGFYAWWRVDHVAVILGSIVVNHVLVAAISGAMAQGRSRAASAWTAAGVALNLAALGWFKYAGFGAEILRDLGLHGPVVEIALPIGISFYTFQQIACLIDARRGAPPEGGLARFALFVTFFPQLVAGPIVHHREMMPQFDAPRREPVVASLAIGATLFVVGLAKKVVIADTAALAADPVFAAADAGAVIGFLDAWAAALAYSVQLYFDFSGYSEMALGLARLFGVVLPMNFAAPYKAASIADFWRRWHVTLSRFLRDYLYVALGGSRAGPVRLLVNLFLTMTLAGLWHGAGWTFVLWGALHGAFLVAHRLWSDHGPKGFAPAVVARWLSWALTFAAVAFGWVLFRAETVGGAWAIWAGMLDPRGIGQGFAILEALTPLAAVALGLGLAFFAPTIHELMAERNTALPSPGYPATAPLAGSAPAWAAWRPSVALGVVAGAGLAAALVLMGSPSPFLYFQF